MTPFKEHFPKLLKYDNLHVKGTCCSFASDCDSLQDRVFINSIQVKKRALSMSTVIEETSESTEQQTTKWVYLFEEGPGDDKALLGGKGAGLCEMTRAGLPVPPGLIVTTQACNAFFDNEKAFPEGMWEQVKEGLLKIEEKVGKKFGDPKNPLLVSVRSGAAFSMPGMMDTVLNLGLN